MKKKPLIPPAIATHTNMETYDFMGETCMNAWKHHTGSRVLSVGVGERQRGLFNSKPAICGL